MKATDEAVNESDTPPRLPRIGDSMNRTLRTFALLAVAWAGGSAFAHARLQASTPVDASTVASPPVALRLQYNEAVEPPLCSVTLTGPGDAEVATGKPVGDERDPKTLVVALPKLPAGAYRARWAAAGHDGHRTRGEIRFTVQ
jgi:methionine-rich copper-binding protein CopC